MGGLDKFFPGLRRIGLERVEQVSSFHNEEVDRELME
jgi:hypothetical protein